MEQLDRELIQMVFNVNNNLLARKQIQSQLYQHVKEENSFNKKRNEISYNIKRFSAYLAFETHQTVINRRIEKGNMKWQRCQKALLDNSSKDNFNLNMPYDFDRLELVDAYKIENGVILKDFEIKLRKQKESFLKGLFVPVSKSELLNLILFGFSKENQDTQELYRDNYLRIPQTYLKNNQSVIEKMLKENFEQNNKNKNKQPPRKTFNAYISPICQQIKDKLKRDLNTKHKDCSLFCVVLCRVIITDQNNKESLTYFNSQNDYYEIKDPACIYPEYIMLARSIKKITPENQNLSSTNITALLQSQYQFQQQSTSNNLQVNNETVLQEQLMKNKDLIFDMRTQINFKIQNFWQRLKTNELKQLQIKTLSEREKNIQKGFKNQIQDLQIDYNQSKQDTEDILQIKNTRFGNIQSQ